MKRQTRPFVVEIKQSRLNPGKSEPKPLWSGRDLLLLREARPELEDETVAVAVAAPEPGPVAVARRARILMPSVTVPPVEEPAVEPVRVEPRKPRVVAVPVEPRKTRVPAPPVEPVPAPAAAVVAPAPEPAVVAEPVPAADLPARLHARGDEPLPRGQRWKRRLPKVLW